MSWGSGLRGAIERIARLVTRFGLQILVVLAIASWSDNAFALSKVQNPQPFHSTAQSQQIIEMYYSLPVLSWRLTFDYQFIVNPAYNGDRGPASVIGTRLRTQF